MKDCFLFVVFLFSVKCFSAQVDQHYFDQSKLLKNLKVFSADSMEGRGTGEPGGLKAQRFIQEQFSGAQLLRFEKDYSHSFNYANPFRKKKIEGTNVIGWIKGLAEPEKYIVISSHHDHLGIRNGEIYNGTDDNGKGTGKGVGEEPDEDPNVAARKSSSLSRSPTSNRSSTKLS